MHAHSSRLAASFLTLALAACDTAPEPVGHIEVALVTTSDSGATYRLPLGTFVHVAGDGFEDSLVLDGDEAAETFDLPVGEFTATLTHPYGYTEDWILTRLNELGQSESVGAKLLTPRSVPIVIDAGVTTSVVFSFRVPSGEVITFERGQLEVTFQIEEEVGDGVYLSTSGFADVTSAEVHTNAPAELAGWWPEVGTEDVDIRLAGAIGKWTMRWSAGVCAELDNTNNFIGNQPALADLLDEAAADAGEVCVYSHGDEHYLEVAFARSGGASTETLGDLGQLDYHFAVTFRFELPVQVFDGETLDLTLIEGASLDLPFSGEVHVSEDASGDWFSGAVTGTSGLVLWPTFE